MDPMAADDEPKSDEPQRQRRARAAPAPGIPMAQEDYERLKEDASTRPLPRSKHAQEDPGKKS